MMRLLPAFSAACGLLVLASPFALAKTVKHTWTITPQYRAPDGHYRMTYEINGQNPGPILEAEEGDDFEITVNNHLPVETTIHWHGILQRGTPEMDGVPGVSQYASPPYGNYTYKFAAPGQYGLHWYHAHVRGYLDDGIKGLIYIHPAAHRTRPFSLISNDTTDLEGMLAAERRAQQLTIYDWRHEQEDQAFAMFFSSGRPSTCVDSVLFNGKGRTYCPSPQTINVALNARYNALPALASHGDSRGCLIIPGTGSFKAEDISSPMGCINSTSALEIVAVWGDWTYLNVANVGGEWTWVLSIDQHDLHVVQADGDYIEPRKVQALPVSIGQRYGVLVHTNKTNGGDYYIRAASQGWAQVMGGVALLRYESACNGSVSTAQERRRDTLTNTYPDTDPWADLTHSATAYNSTPINGAVMFDSNDSPPFAADPPPSYVNVTYFFHANQTETTQFVIASRPLRSIQEFNTPILFRVGGENDDGEELRANEAEDPAWLVRIPKGAVVDVILQNAQNALFPALAEPPHSIHLHGHKFWVLGSKGYGHWSWNSTQEAVDFGVDLNFTDPPTRDTILLPTAGWLVFRFVADNPGAWIMHCHISSHFAAGMGVVWLEAADEIPSISPRFKSRPSAHIALNDTQRRSAANDEVVGGQDSAVRRSEVERQLRWNRAEMPHVFV